MRRIALSLVVVVVIMIGFSGLVFLRPAILINRTTAGLAAGLLRGAGVDLAWRELDVDAASPTFWRKTLSVRAKDLRILVPTSGLDAKIADLQASGAINVRPGRLELTDAGPAHLGGVEIAVAPPPGPPSDAALDLTNLPVPGFLAHATVRPIVIDVTRLDAGGVTGRFRLAVDGGRATIAAQDLCADGRALPVGGCLDMAQVALRLGVIDGHLRLLDLGPARIDATALSAARPPEAPPAVKRSSPGPHLEDLTVHDVRLAVRRWRFHDGHTHASGGLVLTAASASPGTMSLEAELGRVCFAVRDQRPDEGVAGCVVRVAGAATLTATGGTVAVAEVGPASATGARVRVTSRGMPPVIVTGRLAVGGGTTAMTSARAVDAVVTVRRLADVANVRIKGRASADGLDLMLDGSATGFAPGIKRAELRACRVRLDAKDPRPKPATADLSCELRLLAAPLPAQKRIVLDWPPSATLKLTASGSAPLPPGKGDDIAAKAHVLLIPIDRRELSARGHADAEVHGTLSHPVCQIGGEVDLGVPRFEALVAALRASPYAVPAPFHELRGAIDATASVRGDACGSGLTMEFTGRSRLAGTDQVVAVDAKGTLAQSRPMKLALDVLLSDVQLILPRVTLVDKQPQLFPDKRLARVVADADAGAPPPLAYEIRVHTPNPRAVRLVSNLAKAPVPVAVDLTASSTTPLGGRIDIGAAPLQLFRRDAAIDRFGISLGPEAVGLDGLFRVVYTDYTIYIYVLGTADQPVVKLESDPPLPEAQLGATLLFGKDLSELDADQASSADGVRAAAADGALSLASLYLLASTPVESVGYDSSTKAFTAKVALGNGLSLNVGSDFDEYKKAGLRKRLGGPWSIESYFERRAGGDDQSATAMLEWSRRY